jgi:thiazole synthase
MSGAYTLGDHSFESRLIIGTGKYESFEQNLKCVEVSGAEMVTVALRRVNFDPEAGPRLLDVIKPERFTILPNTAGCYTVDDAVTTAHLGRELLDTKLIKLEVIGDERTLFPDVTGTLEAAKILIDDGFTVLPYITDDPVSCQKLEAMGCPAVMPLAALAMELGATAVLMNTGIAHAKDPVAMAEAMKLGIRAGRLAYEAGRMPRKLYATASSPLDQIATF